MITVRVKNVSQYLRHLENQLCRHCTERCRQSDIGKILPTEKEREIHSNPSRLEGRQAFRGYRIQRERDCFWILSFSNFGIECLGAAQSPVLLCGDRTLRIGSMLLLWPHVGGIGHSHIWLPFAILNDDTEWSF